MRGCDKHSARFSAKPETPIEPQPAPVVDLGAVPSGQSPQQQHRIHGRERQGCMGISRPLQLRLKALSLQPP